MRYVIKRFAEALEIIIRPERYVRLDDETVRALKDMLEQAGETKWEDKTRNPARPFDVRNIAEDMLRFGLRYKWTAIENMLAWDQLTPREQEVAAYVCLGYTNSQISLRMVIARSTVKTHVRHVLIKFGLNGKLELKGVLRDWNFSRWEKERG
jgi:DNA-binding CsgD family transcriptional regulator